MSTNITRILLLSLDVVVTELAISFHVFGLYLLFHLKILRSQHVLLINLSLCEILQGGMRNINLFAHIFLPEPRSFEAARISRTISFLVVAPVYIFLMMMLSLDPCLMVVLRVKYESIVVKKRVTLLMIICWFVGTMPGIFAHSFLDLNYIIHITEVVAPVLAVLFIFHTCVTYAVIITKIYSKRNKLEQERKGVETQGLRRHSERNFHLKTPTLIIVTFLVFIVAPLIYERTVRTSLEQDFIIGTLFSCGVASDALIYIYCCRAVKRVFDNMRRKKEQTKTFRPRADYQDVEENVFVVAKTFRNNEINN